VFRAFNELVVYQRAGSFADDIHTCVKRWDPLDAWSAGIQLIRAADSVAANIAEGTGRRTFREQLRFYVMARGSLHELRHWITRATARGLFLPHDIHTRADEVGRMLNGLINTTRTRANQQPRTKN
jgi:four helix bundle protein